jgi:hypothetical protein
MVLSFIYLQATIFSYSETSHYIDATESTQILSLPKFYPSQDKDFNSRKLLINLPLLFFIRDNLSELRLQ